MVCTNNYSVCTYYYKERGEVIVERIDEQAQKAIVVAESLSFDFGHQKCWK